MGDSESLEIGLVCGGLGLFSRSFGNGECQRDGRTIDHLHGRYAPCHLPRNAHLLAVVQLHRGLVRHIPLQPIRGWCESAGTRILSPEFDQGRRILETQLQCLLRRRPDLSIGRSSVGPGTDAQGKHNHQSRRFGQIVWAPFDIYRDWYW